MKIIVEQHPDSAAYRDKANNMKYSFNKEVKQQLVRFRQHLEKELYHKTTIRQKLNYAGFFLQWLENESLLPEETAYNDMLGFIDCCKSNETSKKHINNILRSVRKYYVYLKTNNKEIANPAENLYLKGVNQNMPTNILAHIELEKVFGNYPNQTNRDKRNKIMLGLLIYQALTTEELHQLEPSHLKLKEGKIYIQGNHRRNSRIIELKPFQILDLHEYLTEIRPKILAEITKPKPARTACRSGRKPDKINPYKLQNQLFISMNGSEHLKNSLLHLFKTIQKTNPEILHPKQVRASVISYWLKNYNLRQVQYMAGHKHVHSTERYQLNNLDDLQGKLEKYHPLNENQNPLIIVKFV